MRNRGNEPQLLVGEVESLEREKWNRGRRETIGDGATNQLVKAFQLDNIGFKERKLSG